MTDRASFAAAKARLLARHPNPTRRRLNRREEALVCLLGSELAILTPDELLR